MPLIRMPQELVNNPNAAALGAYGWLGLENGTAAGRFYALKAISNVTITAMTANADNCENPAALIGKTIGAGDVIPIFPTTSITITGSALLFKAPAI